MITEREAKHRVLAQWNDWPAKTGTESDHQAFYQWLTEYHPEALTFHAKVDKRHLVKFWVKAQAAYTARSSLPERRQFGDRRVTAHRRLAIQAATTERRVQDERRQIEDRRRTTLLSAKIIYNDGRSVLSCTIRDLSSGGAKLQFGMTPTCPNQIVLDFGQGRVYHCEVAYRAGDTIGVHFLDSSLPSEAAGTEQ